ncbi:hypothetical protein FVE85_2789 [Porphyridium purpureum]|uniref:Uncharacterized protein n=1 Tax=Porphyridium purpureum TaxID=35688 RepID=A0A5J4YTP3_PORPP|nr:hypothetical protein FVE85_2789 [Porphyridium purpureum]|eukprot:POR0578..scf227_4
MAETKTEEQEEERVMRSLELHKQIFNQILDKYDLRSEKRAGEIADYLTNIVDDKETVSAVDFAEQFGTTESEARIVLSFIMIGIKFKEETSMASRQWPKHISLEPRGSGRYEQRGKDYRTLAVWKKPGVLPCSVSSFFLAATVLCMLLSERAMVEFASLNCYPAARIQSNAILVPRHPQASTSWHDSWARLCLDTRPCRGHLR